MEKEKSIENLTEFVGSQDGLFKCNRSTDSPYFFLITKKTKRKQLHNIKQAADTSMSIE